MTSRRLRDIAAWLLVVVAVCGALLLDPDRAVAADQASIAHAEATADELRLLIDVPAGADLDLDGVTASLDEEELDATAAPSATGSVVERTTVLVIDASRSMRRQDRFRAATEAARAYLDVVPDDVRVGIVTFHHDITTALPPTTDRDAARRVLADLPLDGGTRLYDALVVAADLAGSEGQRSLLVLSDGADTGTRWRLDDVTSRLEQTHTLVDVVSLQQRGAALRTLRTIATSGGGGVVEATADDLTRAFEAQAASLADQVLVTAPLPDGFAATEATVEIVLPTAAGGALVATALVPIQEAPAAVTRDAATTPTNPDGGRQLPGWLLYVAIAVFAAGLVGLAVGLVPPKPPPPTIAERVAAYTGGPAEPARSIRPPEPVLEQVRAAAAGVLHRNRGLEDRLERRLIAAGSEFRPSEWLLLHGGVVVGAGLVGLLLGRGDLAIGVLFGLAGGIAPPIYLHWRTGRRRRAFDNALPETLQLMSGALAAGLSLAQSVDTVVDEGPDPVASEFRRVLVETRVGVGLDDAFDGVAARFGSSDFSWVVMAIRIQRQVGGNLAELLTTVADTMRERGYLRRQVQTLSAEGRLSAMILAGLPPFFLMLLQLLNPGYSDVLFSTPLGIAMLASATVLLGVGMFWMSRMVRVEL